MKNYFLLLLILIHGFVFGQQSWYVSQQTGSDDHPGISPDAPFGTVSYAVGFLSPGDTLFFMGEFTNSSFDPDYVFSGDINDPYIWNSENSVRITGVQGEVGKYITFKSYDENTIFKGDGSNIVRFFNCSYVMIDGFDVYGQVESIPMETAKALQFLYKDADGVVHYRVPPGTPEDEIDELVLPVLENITRPSYTDTRGIYMSSVDHVIVKNSKVRYMPGVGLRLARCDYVNITGNEVHDCSRKSYSGTHGLVVSSAASIDEYDGYKIFIIGNLVHHNFNEIYSWSPNKTFITTHIDEGKGISLQKNVNEWLHGRFLVANNIAYWNGYSGVHANVAKSMDFINNTCYYNCYTALITYEDTVQYGKNMGISVSTADDIKMINNISVLDGGTKAFALSVASTTELVVINNLIYGDGANLLKDSDVVAVEVNTIEADPLFKNPQANDFHLVSGSPAIDHADPGYAPEYDYYGVYRDVPDIGAVEYISPQGFFNGKTFPYRVYPLPFDDHIVIEGNTEISLVKVYDISGKAVNLFAEKSVSGRMILNTADLVPGVYILKIGDHTKTLIKQ
jgi:hypothetical protein